MPWLLLGLFGLGAAAYVLTRPGTKGTVVTSLVPHHWYAVTTMALGPIVGDARAATINAESNVGAALKMQGFIGKLGFVTKQGADKNWYVKAIGPWSGGQATLVNTPTMQVLQIEEVNPPAIQLTS